MIGFSVTCGEPSYLDFGIWNIFIHVYVVEGWVNAHGSPIRGKGAQTLEGGMVRNAVCNLALLQGKVGVYF